MKEWDTKMWKQEMEGKVSLKLYREMRQSIGGQDKIYDNREATIILFRSYDLVRQRHSILQRPYQEDTDAIAY
ncbi:hypothetical protein E2C01_065099 [Portunus trituberculatus]|uniref:Uncharacterized protein n=1 Tax=Portunus trituberculatus TaxID=210409 RepID=A0A5B7HQ62_PORTR|nr:hypothetical protein [Portunus trituberculatus]